MRTKWHKSDEIFRRFGPLTFADVLNGFRRSDEKSLKEYALKLGVTPANLCDLEKGRKLPSPTRAATIAKKLGLPVMLLVQVALQDQLRAAKLRYKVSLAA